MKWVQTRRTIFHNLDEWNVAGTERKVCFGQETCINSSLTHNPSAAPRYPTVSNTELAVKVKVLVGDGEPIESALRRFKREINKSGHLMELRHRRYFENSQDEKKRKIKEARMRKKFERMAKRRAANRT